MNYTVLFDGTRNAPLGRQLMTAEETPNVPEVRPRISGLELLERMRALLVVPMTMRELAHHTDEPLDRVNQALYTLQHKGEVEKVGERTRVGRPDQYGRQVESVYGLRGLP